MCRDSFIFTPKRSKSLKKKDKLIYVLINGQIKIREIDKKMLYRQIIKYKMQCLRFNDTKDYSNY